MDPVKLEKIHAMNKYYYSKKHMLVHSLFFYPPVTVLACSVFCSFALWYPSLFSFMKLFLSNSLPFLMSSKFLFLLGNLIIILLVGQSKFFASKSAPRASDVYYHEYINQKRSCGASVTTCCEEKKEEEEDEEEIREKCLELCEGRSCEEKKLEVENESKSSNDVGSISNEELNRRADDFIARVNRQRRLEATLLLC